VPEDINLLVKKPIEAYPFSKKFLWWATGIGRAIIIGTEIVVLAVFGARFKLDYEISNLAEKIENKQAIVASFADFEAKFRVAQDRLNLAQQILASDVAFTKGIDFLTSKVPQGVSFYDFSLKKDHLAISALSQGGHDFSKLLAVLVDEERIESVALTSAHLDPEEGVYEFTLDLGIAADVFK